MKPARTAGLAWGLGSGGMLGLILGFAFETLLVGVLIGVVFAGLGWWIERLEQQMETETKGSTMTWLWTHALGLVLPLVIAALAYWLTNVLKDAVTAIGKANAATKQVIVVVLSLLLAWLASLVGGALPAGCSQGVPNDPLTCMNALTEVGPMTVLLSALAAHVIHAGQKADAK